MMENGLMEERVERVRNFLCGYQICVDMLQLRRRERKRKPKFDEEFVSDFPSDADEVLWRTRMFEVKTPIDRMKNGREKLMLYYHYVRGESVEHVANMLGFSRRTGYRVHQKALQSAALLFDLPEKNGFYARV
jgi:hypothetical protein